MDVLSFLTDHGSVLIVVVALLVGGLGVPLPEDVAVLAAGVIAHRGSTPGPVVFGACFVAVLAGDTLLLAIVHRFGERLVQRRPVFSWLLTPARRERVHALFERRGNVAVFVGRHLSALRGTIFAVAALEGIPYPAFIAWDALGALVTVPVVFGLGYVFSAHVALVEEGIARTEHWLAVGALVALVVWVVVRRASTSRSSTLSG